MTNAEPIENVLEEQQPSRLIPPLPTVTQDTVQRIHKNLQRNPEMRKLLKRLLEIKPRSDAMTSEELDYATSHHLYHLRIYENAKPHEELLKAKRRPDLNPFERMQLEEELSREQIEIMLPQLANTPVIFQHEISSEEEIKNAKSYDDVSREVGLVVDYDWHPDNGNLDVWVQLFNSPEGWRACDNLEMGRITGASLHHRRLGNQVTSREVSLCVLGKRDGTGLLPGGIWDFESLPALKREPQVYEIPPNPDYQKLQETAERFFPLSSQQVANLAFEKFLGTAKRKGTGTRKKDRTRKSPKISESDGEDYIVCVEEEDRQLDGDELEFLATVVPTQQEAATLETIGLASFSLSAPVSSLVTADMSAPAAAPVPAAAPAAAGGAPAPAPAPAPAASVVPPGVPPVNAGQAPVPATDPIQITNPAAAAGGAITVKASLEVPGNAIPAGSAGSSSSSAAGGQSTSNTTNGAPASAAAPTPTGNTSSAMDTSPDTPAASSSSHAGAGTSGTPAAGGAANLGKRKESPGESDPQQQQGHNKVQRLSEGFDRLMKSAKDPEQVKQVMGVAPVVGELLDELSTTQEQMARLKAYNQKLQRAHDVERRRNARDYAQAMSLFKALDPDNMKIIQGYGNGTHSSEDYLMAQAEINAKAAASATLIMASDQYKQLNIMDGANPIAVAAAFAAAASASSDEEARKQGRAGKTATPAAGAVSVAASATAAAAAATPAVAPAPAAAAGGAAAAAAPAAAAPAPAAAPVAPSPAVAVKEVSVAASATPTLTTMQQETVTTHYGGNGSSEDSMFGGFFSSFARRSFANRFQDLVHQSDAGSHPLRSAMDFTSQREVIAQMAFNPQTTTADKAAPALAQQPAAAGGAPQGYSPADVASKVVTQLGEFTVKASANPGQFASQAPRAAPPAAASAPSKGLRPSIDDTAGFRLQGNMTSLYSRPSAFEEEDYDLMNPTRGPAPRAATGRSDPYARMFENRSGGGGRLSMPEDDDLPMATASSSGKRATAYKFTSALG